MEDYNEYLERTSKKDCKESWIQWKIEVYQYPKAKARKRAETQYFPLSEIDYEQTVIGLNIKYLRQQKKLTQKQLMEELDIKDRMLISRWEKGIYLPDASQIKMLSDYFDISHSELLNKKLYKQQNN